MATLFPDEELPKDQKVSLDPAPTSVSPDPGAVALATDKAQYALGDQGPGPGAIQNYFATGTQDQLQQRTMTNVILADRQRKSALIQKLAVQAASENRPLSVAEYQYIQGLNEQDLQDSDKTILEHLYARHLVQDTVSNPDPTNKGWAGLLQGASQENQSATQDLQLSAEQMLTKQEIAKTILQGIQTKYDQENLVSKAWDFGRDFLPFYSGWNQAAPIDGVNSETDIPFSRVTNAGTAVANQIKGLWLLPPKEFQAAVQTKIDELAGTSNAEALQFAQSVLQYTYNDEASQDLQSIMDVASGAGAVKRLGTGLKGLIKANTGPQLGPISRKVIIGDVAGAAEDNARQRIQSVIPPQNATQNAGLNGGPTPTPVTQRVALQRVAPSIMDPHYFVRDPGSLSQERANRLVDALSYNQKMLLSTVEDVGVVQRTSEDAFKVGVQEAEQDFRRQYTKLEDSIIDVRPVRESSEVFGGADRIDVLLGDPQALPFRTESKARFYAQKMYRLPEGSFELEQQGNNWLVRVPKTINETSNGVMDARVRLDNQTPHNWTNIYLGFLRNPDDIVSPFERMNRKVGTYGGNAVALRLREVAKSIGAVSKEERDRLSTIMDEASYQWRAVATSDGPKRVQGLFYNNVAEFETAYLTRFHQMPSEKELQAYFSFRQIMDFDYIQRNAGLVRDKSRLGIEQRSIKIPFSGKADKTLYRDSDFFEARNVKELPYGSDRTVLYVHPEKGQVEFTRLSHLSGKERMVIQKIIDDGGFISQTYDPFDKSLGDLASSGGEPVNYVVSALVKSKPIDPIQIPYEEGGHWRSPQSSFFIKQAQTYKSRFGRRIYRGDKTAFQFQVRKLGNDLLQNLEKGREMLLQGVPSEDLDRFIANGHLPFDDGEDFKRQFRFPGESRDTNDAPFDLRTPFVLTETGQSTRDLQDLSRIFGEEIFDGDAELQARVNREFTQQRSNRSLTVNNLGTEQNPVYKIDQAPTMDPFQSLARTAHEIARNRFFDDYKHQAVEDWAHQFADTLDQEFADIQRNPMRAFLDGHFKTNYSNRPKLAAAQNSRQSILNLLNIPSEDAATWKWARQKVIDSIYAKNGQQAAEAIGNRRRTATAILEPWQWTDRTNPATIMRSWVAHAKLGLYAPIQFVLQASTVTHAMAIDGNPVRAAKSVFAYWYMRMRGITPGKPLGQISESVGKALGISRDVLDDLYDAWQRSGMNVVEGEYGLIDDYLDPQMFESTNLGKKALNGGMTFFKEGNNTHRGTSFALSYLEWRDRNPTARVTNDVLRQIVDRADLMYINMSRASNAAIQKGIASIPLQFFGYHMRLNEQMFSNRLTWPEKIRLFSMYSALWGVPVGLGAVAGTLWPFHDSVKQYALEHGIDADHDAIAKFVTDGAATVLTDWATGDNYDIAGRLGPGGLSWIHDIMNGDLTQAYGAGPNFIGSLWDVAQPFGRAMASVFQTHDDTRYNLTSQDFIDALSQISVVKNATRAVAAYNAGQWMTSKSAANITTLEKGNPVQALMIGLGFTPEVVSEYYLKTQSNKEHQAVMNDIENEVLKNFRLGLKAAVGRDEKQTLTFFRRAHALMVAGGFTPTQQASVFERALSENQDLASKVDRQFLLNDPTERQNLYGNQ